MVNIQAMSTSARVYFKAWIYHRSTSFYGCKGVEIAGRLASEKTGRIFSTIPELKKDKFISIHNFCIPIYW